MTSIHRVGAALAAVVLLASCTTGGSKPGADRVLQLTSDLGIQKVGWAQVTSDQVWVRSVKDGAWQTATLTGKTSQVQGTESSDFGWKQVAPAELKVSDLEQAMTQHEQQCQQGLQGQVGATTTGALLSLVTCNQKVVSTAVSGAELAPIKQWDAVGIDTALKDVAAVQGPQARHLSFSTPKSGTVGGKLLVRDIGAPVTGVDGKPCMVTVTRFGTPDEALGTLDWAGCDQAEPFGDGTFARSEVSGAAIEQGLTKAASVMGIDPTDIGSFDVFSQKGVLRVQASAGDGVPAKAPSVTVPLG
ncbi:hypothetical protein [Aestuariimicrobium kwangyangense]|uniref:hypothetical protein n=1 Tax=Aestuariimicrobium kwangyangense TaxID=396389 RepID=UPI0003B66B37|nr:hypothetical protein [Aestuariimicrobium kwangyangense]